MAILVIGDLMLDSYWYGESTRVSPEAPVPIVDLHSMENKAGGAANVAINLSDLGADVIVMGQVGNDKEGEILSSILSRKCDASYISIYENYKTTHKLRIYSGDEYKLRVDSEIMRKFRRGEIENIMYNIARINLDIVIISDYNKSFLNEELCQKVINYCRSKGIKVIADPKSNSLKKYMGASIITPNLFELSQLSGFDYGFIRDDESKAIELVLKCIDSVLLTKSESGMSFYDGSAPIHLPSSVKNPISVIGAGDGVVACLGFGLTNGWDVVKCMEFANEKLATGMMRPGTISLL